MSAWDAFPADYRAAEVRTIQAAVKGGECVAVVGLSGAGKSNLLGFLAAQAPAGGSLRYMLVDGNRLTDTSVAAFLALMQQALELAVPGPDADDLETAVKARRDIGLCFLLDLSLLVNRTGQLLDGQAQRLWGQLRALRDQNKYGLTYVVATRHVLPSDNELAELLFGHTLWLGPLTAADARWNVARYAARTGQAWDVAQISAIMAVSGRYPALLRAVCEARAAGAALEVDALLRHPAVAARVAEFWEDQPEASELHAAGLDDVPLLTVSRPISLDTARLTAKELRLLQAFETRPGEVCEKDDLIRAVWSEDRVFESGVRDDSLAQLVRRLREKIEADAGNPRYIQTVPGRGYRFVGRLARNA